MSTSELNAMQTRYTVLEHFCAAFEVYNPYNRRILVNKPIIQTISGKDVWMEDYLPTFQKFWGTSQSQSERMVTSSSRALSTLQFFIFHQSGQSFTIVDLQGGVHEGNYILCDIEFTNTLSSSPDLLKTYLASPEFRFSKANGLLPLNWRNEASSAWYSQFDTADPPNTRDVPAFIDSQCNSSNNL